MEENVGIGGRTHAPGHILVSTNRGMFLNASGGLLGPKALVKLKAVSRAMYVVAAKKMNAKIENGCEEKSQISIPITRKSRVEATGKFGTSDRRRCQRWGNPRTRNG